MIKEAAILNNGVIYTGRRHSDVIHKIILAGESFKGIQGFVTDDGKFMDRHEAFEEALRCGQIKEPSIGSTRTLISEDLY